MQITLSVEEAVALVGAVAPLPPFVGSVRGEGASVHAEIDLGLVPDLSGLARLAVAAVGRVVMTARLAGYDGGDASFEVRAEARGLPAHRLLNVLAGTVDARLRARGLPDGLVEVRAGSPAPHLVIHLQAAIRAAADGLTLTSLELRDGSIHADVAVRATGVHLHGAGPGRRRPEEGSPSAGTQTE